MNDRALQLCNKIQSCFFQTPQSVPRKSYATSQEGWDETSYFHQKDWRELAIQDFNSHPYCLSFFAPEAFPFYFGALMYLSIAEQNFECRALENFLTMWEEIPDFDEEVLDASSGSIPEMVVLELREVLSDQQIGIIECYFDFRASWGIDYDRAASTAFVKSLRNAKSAARNIR